MIGGGYTAGDTGYEIGELDPFNQPQSDPIANEPLDLNWPVKWTFNGGGFARYGVPKETFYLAYQGAGAGAGFASLKWKLYRETRGEYVTQQTVTSFHIIGYTTIERSLEQAIIKAKIWLVNRYMNYPYDMGELDWNESQLWAESYVNSPMTGGNSGVLFMAIAAIIGIVILAKVR